MGSARPRFRLDPEAAAAPERPAAGRGRAWTGRVLAGLVLAWAGGASWLAFENHRTAQALRAEQEELRQAYEEKVRALVRRMVGVASHQMLEKDGLEGRMTDLITRQVQLENRQAALNALLEQAGSWGGPARAPTPAPPGASPTPPAPAADPPSPALRLGAPAPGGTAAPPARPPEAGPQAPPRPRSDRPLREVFAELEASVRRVETAQVRSLDGLSRLSQSRAALVRSALGELGLNPDRLAPGVFAAAGGNAPMGGPLLPLRVPAARPVRDPFANGAEELRQHLLLLQRLRPVAEALPLRRPVEGVNNLTSNFGPRTDPFTGATAMHAGMDFRAATGTPIHAAGSGRVVTAGEVGGYGNLVELDHGHGIATRYGHMSQILVAQGQTVAFGTVIGLVGSTGRSTGPHLHYETRINGGAVDPMRFLRTGARLLAPLAEPPQHEPEASSQDPADDHLPSADGSLGQ